MSCLTRFQLLALLLASCFSASAAPPKEAVVSFSVYGAVRIGMNVAELTAAVGQELKRTDEDWESDDCRYVQLEKGDGNLNFMLIDDRLARIDVNTPSIRTTSGAHVGMKASDVLGIYGKQAEVTPHAYTGPEGTYITVHAPGGKFGIRFETENGVVERYYAGTAEAIEYIEGCL
jgi:hypothetical protein